MQIILIIFLILVPLSLAGAGKPLSVVINEIAWMGTESSPNDEWIELYNNLDSQVNVDGWKLVSEDGTPKIALEGKIPRRGFFLLERTDDETVPNIGADLIYQGALANQGENLKLIDDRGKIIDEINCSAGWFAGDKETKKTMERKDPLALGNDPSNWQTSQEPGGSPKAKNSPAERERTTTSQKIEMKQPEPRVYPSNIFINEILPSPEGPDSENEWIELKNENDFEVDLSGWQIRDKIGSTKTFTIPRGTKIKPKGFLVFPRPETKITLQNSGDGIELLNPNQEIIDQITYEKAPSPPPQQSYNRISFNWAWSTTPTPGKKNVITQSKIGAKKEEKVLKKGGEKENNPSPEKFLSAKISQNLPEKSPPSLLIFLLAGAVAVGSALTLLFLKKRLGREELEMEEKEWKL